MPLKTIDNPERLLAEAECGPQGHPVVRLPGTEGKWLLKLELHGSSEVLAYQLALRLAVPVLPAIPVWCPRAFGSGGCRAGEGRIGLAIKYAETFEILTLEQAAARSPTTVTAALLLCMLDRHEWGQFAATEAGMIFFDLERLFAPFCPERLDSQTWGDVSREVNDAGAAFKQQMRSRMQQVIEEATRLGLAESLRHATGNAAAVSVSELVDVFDLEPHPLARQIIRIAANSTTAQFKLADRHLNF